jgi:hypothetical protein
MRDECVMRPTKHIDFVSMQPVLRSCSLPSASKHVGSLQKREWDEIDIERERERGEPCAPLGSSRKREFHVYKNEAALHDHVNGGIS